MGKHKLFCVFGEYEQDFSYVHIDGLCDYAFFTFYGKNQASFSFFVGPVMRDWLNKARDSKTTFYGIHVTQGSAGVAMRAALEKVGENAMNNFWHIYKIYHYGVLDLEIKPWEASTMDTRIKEVFEFLKVMRDLQKRFKKAYPRLPSPPRGFIVLGIRLWPANMVPFLAAINNAFEKFFIVDGLIPLTHMNEDEFIGGYKECWISGGAPYRLAPSSQNSNVLGMEKIIEAINFTTWNGYPSLAVSVPMCTRVYRAKAATAALDAPCVTSTWGVNTTLTYCNSSLNPYANPTVDATQNVVVGTSKKTGAKDVLSTFESQSTINTKFCDINKMYENLDLGLALFDLECEDWELGCPPPTAGIYATNRFGNVSQHTHMLANAGVANTCP